LIQTYPQKKKNIYAYRRRNFAKKCITRLNQISTEMSKKDLKELDKKVSALSFDLAIKLGVLDNIFEGKKILELFDKRKTVAQERKEERKTEKPVFIQPMATYICPKCKKAGYLFLPNIDTEASKLERSILHVPTTGEPPSMCKIQEWKLDNLILIMKTPTEGIVTTT
jgi:hypothetical protein